MPRTVPQPASPVWSADDIRRLQIRSSRLVSSIFAGDYRSIFRGRGMEFEEVREYQPGDDVRCIDWNVTARVGRPFVKQFMEEREMTVMLLVDCSGSLACPSPGRSTGRLAAELCAILAYAAARSNDRIGLLTFTDRIEHYIPPRKGLHQARKIIAQALRQPAGRGTDLAGALEYLARVQRSGAIIFVISDFISTDATSALTRLARRNDLVAVMLHDPAAQQLEPVGLLQVTDAESEKRLLIDTGDKHVQELYRDFNAARQARLIGSLAAAGAHCLPISTDCSPLQTLAGFFRSRRQRGRR